MGREAREGQKMNERWWGGKSGEEERWGPAEKGDTKHVLNILHYTFPATWETIATQESGDRSLTCELDSTARRQDNGF
jgi:hypothetical protein